MPKVSAEHKAAVRQQPVEAATRVMARNEPITTRAITAEADVSAGTLYNYFDSLSDLVAAAGEWVLATEWRRFRPEIDPDGSYGGLMDVLDEFVLNRPSARDDGMVAQLRTRLEIDGEVDAAIRRFNGFVADLMTPLVADGIDAGHVSDRIDPRALVELLDLVRDALHTPADTDTEPDPTLPATGTASP